MKFTYNWLREYIDIDLTPVQIADRLTMLGLEVDACIPCYPDLSGVLVGRIEAVQQHPNADKLVLCDVNIGAESKRVVCGAPNARVGLVTAVALPGTVMPGGFTIKPAKIRGQESFGMLCSAKELGISEEQSGIMELSQDLSPGQPLSEALQLDDTMIEVDLTPNRPDCASVLGIGRELAGVVGKRMRPPVVNSVSFSGKNLPFSIRVESAVDCPRYAARLLKNVQIGPSPWWLQQRLLAVGMRPINNVVDVTNYVMLEYGQPLHAFDFRRIGGGEINVRRARPGEQLTTLDKVQRILDTDMLLICDADKPIALAGIMGGSNSEVDDQTSDILLESACFSPIGIRRTAGKIGISTEASYRFERGVDPAGVLPALERAVQLIVLVAGGHVVEDGVDYCEGVVDRSPINLRVGRTCRLLGMKLSASEITEALSGIEIGVEALDADNLRVTPPSFRVDIEREIDLVEEVARIVGYNNIPTTLPRVPMNFSEQDFLRELRTKISSVLTSIGFYESINYSFVSPQHYDMMGLSDHDQLRDSVHLLNPLAEDQSVLRTSLLPGLLENVRRNLNHQNLDIRLFEVGKVFHPLEGKQPDEPFRLCAVLSGRRFPCVPLLYAGDVQSDIYDIKGAMQQLFASLRLGALVSFDAFSGNGLPFAEEGTVLTMRSGTAEIGFCGAVAQGTLRAFGIKQKVYFADVALDQLAGIEPPVPKFSALPKYPFVKWDLALIVPEQVSVGEMLEAITDCDDAIIEKADIFDIFKGKNIEPGKKSVAVSITYRSVERTLDDESVGKVHKKITDLMIARFDGQLREA